MGIPEKGELLTNPDVLIIGAGAAGIAAAAGAFEHNATVTILEKNSYPGGKATAAFVGTVCGLYYRSDNKIAEFVNQGFPMDFANRLAENSKTSALQFGKGLHFLPYNNFEFVRLSDSLLKKSATSVCFHAHVCDVEMEANKIISVTSLIDNAKVKINPKAVVDASGENLVSRFLGVKSLASDNYQAAAQVFQLSGIKENDFSVLNFALLRCVQKAFESGLLQEYFTGVSLVPGSLINESVLLKLPLPDIINHKTLNRTNLELHARELIAALIKFLKNNCESFKNCSLTFVAPEAGIRTGPRNEGNYVLCADDVLSAKKKIDSIARGAWPVEFWVPGKKVEMEYFNMNDYYDIPAGAIRSKYVSNLYFGGRNISADDKAIASARVIGTCLATGYAAGALAAGNSNNTQESITIKKVQKSFLI